MAIAKVTIVDGCIVCALCEQTCPEVFEVTDTARVRPGVDLNQFESTVREAAELCPVQVIKVE